MLLEDLSALIKLNDARLITTDAVPGREIEEAASVELGGNNIQASNPNSEQPQISEANPYEMDKSEKPEEENESDQQREEHLEAKDELDAKDMESV